MNSPPPSPATSSEPLRLVATGPTPAIQRTGWVDHLEPGAVNRFRRLLVHASGKAANVARAARDLGARTCTLTPTGGMTGDLWQHLMHNEGLPYHVLPSPYPTRICTTVISMADASVTELVEEGPPLDPDLADIWAEAIREQTATAHAFVFSGNLPPGTSAAIIRKIFNALPDSLPLLIDTSGPAALALQNHPHRILKMNWHEWEATHRIAPRTVDPREFAPLVITHGDQPILAWNADRELIELSPPRVDRPVNTTGCGDAFSAALILALAQRHPLAHALHQAAEAASASATTAIPGAIREAAPAESSDS
ncbi:MAG TPA: PfkB family carbohydrate kinase [Kiritimatiellia bacterium]|nr:PfkB family carbohydrate kinase [Kiritimatiellia bacterium]